MHSSEFQKAQMEEMCDYVEYGGTLDLQSPRDKLVTDFARHQLKRLGLSNLINPDSHLQQGIREISYSKEGVSIKETPLQYPDGRLVKAINDGEESHNLVGPMTGVFSHYYGYGLYAGLVRGTEISAPGMIQIPAGMGEYNANPADTAIKEVAEEMYGAKTQEEIIEAIEKNEITPGIADKRFQDITPFMKSAYFNKEKIGEFVQPLFSYVFTGRLDNISPVIKSNSELEHYVSSLPKERSEEASPFVIPLVNLRDFLEEVDREDKFYGPVKRTAFNFLEWFNRATGNSI